MNNAERLVYAAAFAHSLRSAEPDNHAATEAARFAAAAVQDLRMASTYLDPMDHADQFVSRLLDEYRRG